MELIGYCRPHNLEGNQDIPTQIKYLQIVPSLEGKLSCTSLDTRYKVLGKRYNYYNSNRFSNSTYMPRIDAQIYRSQLDKQKCKSHSISKRKNYRSDIT